MCFAAVCIKTCSVFRGREYAETDYLTGHTDKPTNVSFKSSKPKGGPAGDGHSDSFFEVPRKSPPRPADYGSPGRIGDLSSIQRDPFDGL